MPTVLECLTHCPNPYYTQIISTTVSAKQNAINLPGLIRDFHGNGTTMFSADPATDNPRYSRILPALPSAVATEVHNEGDVRRVWAYITSWAEHAFDVVPKVWHRWEAGPPGLGVTTSETIDTWWGVYLGRHQRCAAIGELKRPGVIQKEEWYRAAPLRDTSMLGKEMRMYAHQYKCPQAFIFDGNYLLITRFRATNGVDDIRNGNCYVDCFFVSKESNDIPYWIDRLIAEGLNRLRAERAQPLNLDGYDRYFQYYDGKPYWEHPAGYKRHFVNGEYRWYLNNANKALDTPKLE
ncbi:hypothetical protein EAF04_004353 [Stromatinia cepivora]|nr:hypothetical protein EAF04_004353 [Stromatinia cepivora]